MLLFRYVPNRYPRFLQEQRAESRVVALYFAKCGMRDAEAPARPYEPEYRNMNRQIALAALAALALIASAAAAGAQGFEYRSGSWNSGYSFYAPGPSTYANRYRSARVASRGERFRRAPGAGPRDDDREYHRCRAAARSHPSRRTALSSRSGTPVSRSRQAAWRSASTCNPTDGSSSAARRSSASGIDLARTLSMNHAPRPEGRPPRVRHNPTLDVKKP